MKTRVVSVGLAVLSFAALTAAAVVIFRGMDVRVHLESRNDGERTINQLFTSLRDFKDFGTAIEGTPSLLQKIIGVAVYSDTGGLLYSWGTVRGSYSSADFRSMNETERMAEMYIENASTSSTVILLHPLREGPPPPPPGDGEGHDGRSEPSFMSDTLRKANLISLEIRQPAFWREKKLQTVLFPIVEALLAALVVFVRFLILRNGEYRSRIEQQKNLVVLGTAASTLAHEIKNPLLTIRLQTGILARSAPGVGNRELSIIDDEVDRLSMLSHRVNDILRDPAGSPQLVDAVDIAVEVASRLCGRINFKRPGPLPRVRIDPERLRSILENLLRNAMESGGPEEDVAIEFAGGNGQVRIGVLDRGTGIPRNDRGRVFDPFFTTKSRGTGIGLAVCRRFVLAAGGMISIDDRAGGGTRAQVVLPASSRTDS